MRKHTDKLLKKSENWMEASFSYVLEKKIPTVALLKKPTAFVCRDKN